MNDGSDKPAIVTTTIIATSTQDQYRRVLTAANKLEAIQNKHDSVIDLFATPVVSNLFSKLCNECVNLLVRCDFKLEEFRRAEELVWRRVYHDVYRLLKSRRPAAGPQKQDDCLTETHFMSGIGHYSGLIVQLRVRFRITEQVHGVIGPLDLALAPVEGLLDGQWLGLCNENTTTNKHNNVIDSSPGSAAHQWARQAIYRSLVYMGDLARYLLEFSEFDHRKLAFELYRSASRYQPDHGLPYNQLATLAGGLNHNLDAVCNYMRCCMRPKPFERAEGNMVKLFELNLKHYTELLSSSSCSSKHVLTASEVLASREPAREAEDLMKSAIVTFLKLASDLWFATGDNLGKDLQDTVVLGTQRFFEILREAMELEPFVPFASSMSSLDIDFRPISGGNAASDHDRVPRFVSPTIIYEFCSIALMLIARRQQNPPPKAAPPSLAALSDNISDLANTLALNLLHYATSKCQRMIISKIQDIRLARQSQDLSSASAALDRSGGLAKPSSGELLGGLGSSSPVSSEATSRRVMSRLRQRKAATTYTTTTTPTAASQLTRPQNPRVPHSDDSDLSELEETALSTIDALDISSDMSDCGPEYKTDDLINLDSSSTSGRSDDGLVRASTRRNLLSRPPLRPTRSQTYEHKSANPKSDSCSSLPMPDLLTGDISLVNISLRTDPTIYHDASETPSEFGSELRLNSSSLVDSTLAYIYNQTYLPTIKVLFDWLLSNGPIIDSNLESFSSFQTDLQKIVVSLEELKLLIEPSDSTESEIYGHTFCGPEWTQKYPLSCDFAFVNLSPLQEVHEANIEFDCDRELDEAESGFITIQCVMAFSHALSIFLKNKITSRSDG